MGRYTDTLFARPSFLGGAASVLDMGGTLMEFNRSQTPEEADAQSLRMDMLATVEDFRVAVEKLRQEYNEIQSQSL